MSEDPILKYWEDRSAVRTLGRTDNVAISRDGVEVLPEGTTAADITDLNELMRQRNLTLRYGPAPTDDEVARANAVLGIDGDPLPPGATGEIMNIPRNALEETIGDAGLALEKGLKFLSKFSVDVPLDDMLDLMGFDVPPETQGVKISGEDAARLFVGDIGKLMDEMSKGFMPWSGEGLHWQLKPEAIDLLIPLELGGAAAGKAIGKAAIKAAQ